MKALYLSFTLLIFYLPTATIAQTTLSGSVRTSDNKPLPYASVALLNARDSSLVKGAISRETGAYTFDNVPTGAIPAGGFGGWLCPNPVGHRTGRNGVGFAAGFGPA